MCIFAVLEVIAGDEQISKEKEGIERGAKRKVKLNRPPTVTSVKKYIKTSSI